MDGDRFDALTRTLGRGQTRRRLLAGAAAGIAGLFGLRQTPAGAQSCATVLEECPTGTECCAGLACHLQSIECIERGNGLTGLGGLCIDDTDCRSDLACDPTGHCRLGPNSCSADGEACQFHDACCGLLVCIGYEATGTGRCGGGICGAVDENCGTYPSGVLPCCDGFVCSQGICQTAPKTGAAAISIHVAVCPTGVGPDIFNQCHGNSLAGVPFSVAGIAVASGADGVATASVAVGDAVVAEDAATFGAYLGAYVYCSEQRSGAVLYNGSADAGAVSLTANDGDDIICDWYNITAASSGPNAEPSAPSSTGPAAGGAATSLPATGVAGSPNVDNVGWIDLAALGAAASAWLAANRLRDRGDSEGERKPHRQ